MLNSGQFRILRGILIGSLVLAASACSIEPLQQTTAPSRTAGEGSGSAASDSSGPDGAAAGSQLPDMSQDGTYSLTLDPSVANTLVMGPNRLAIPAGAICAVGSSSYGPEFWNSPCASETKAVTLTIVISSKSAAGTSIDFNPALRFEPASNVTLTLSAPSVSVKDAKEWVILYCPSATSTTSGQGAGGNGGGKDGNKCVNESLKDKDLRTHIDYDLKQLFRRIKHFSRYAVARSGYTVAE
jgi:hypothetical protein